jgi:hypothetical protein
MAAGVIETETNMYKNIMAAIDLDDETSWRKPFVAAVDLAHRFGAELHALSVIREVEAVLLAKSAPLGYDPIVSYVENRIAAVIRQVNAYDLHPRVTVIHGASIYVEILRVAIGETVPVREPRMSQYFANVQDMVRPRAAAGQRRHFSRQFEKYLTAENCP